MLLSRGKFFLLIALISWAAASGQTGTSSNPTNGRENDPYSKYGIGEFMNGNNAVLRGIGNVTSAYENPYGINSDNPASYPYLARTTFELGATGSTRSVTGSGLTYQTGTASISYLTLAMPAGKHGGLCLGFKPFTRVYYNMVDTINVPISPIGQTIRTYNGEGGLSLAYLGGGFKIKDFSFGVNVGYMFGNMRSTTASIPIDTTFIYRAYNAEYNNYTSIGGLYWKAGLMYERKLDSDYVLNIGGTLAIQQNLVERLNAYQIANHNFGDTVVNDTTYRSGELHGNLTMPMTYSIGVMLTRKDKWSLGIDYTGTNWANYSSKPDTALNVGVGSTSYKFSLGGEYTPDVNNIRSYFSRVTYRLGLYYGSDYLKINNTTLPFYGLTAGVSLPFRRSTSKLHMAIDIGKLGVTTNNLLQENYFRFTLGVSINDRWFIPRKYD